MAGNNKAINKEECMGFESQPQTWVHRVALQVLLPAGSWSRDWTSGNQPGALTIETSQENVLLNHKADVFMKYFWNSGFITF